MCNNTTIATSACPDQAICSARCFFIDTILCKDKYVTLVIVEGSCNNITLRSTQERKEVEFGDPKGPTEMK